MWSNRHPACVPARCWHWGWRVRWGGLAFGVESRALMVLLPACLAPPLPSPPCSDALEGHVAAVVGAEVSRTLGKCGLAEVVQRLQAHQVGVLV